MRPWTNDAKDIGEIRENDLVISPSIKEFIHPDERDRIFYIVAPKGIGKTLLLIYKRQLYDTKYIKVDYDKKSKKEELYLIPKDLPLDRCLDITRSTLTNDKIELLSDRFICRQLWKFCISISIIKNILKFYKPKYLEDLNNALIESLREINIPKDIDLLIKSQIIITPSGHFNSILKFNYNDIIKTINLQSQISEIIRTNIRSGVAVFIDNVDQSFDDYLQSMEVYSESSKLIWYTTQIGLILAIYDLSAMNGHIKVFASIRKEAFQRMREIGCLGAQIGGETLDLAYTANQLKEIFIKNIQIMDEKDLVLPVDIEENPIHAFLGLKDNKIETINNMSENIFTYIHRHSLKRPRDLMIIGRSLRNLEVKERIPENIKRVINSAADEIATDFMAEILPFTNMIDFDKLFGLIRSNVLSKNSIIKICETYNQQDECRDEDCDRCERAHVFYELYKFGLLGVIKRDLEDKEKLIQKFMQIGDIDFEEKLLPYSTYYLIHPVLLSKIEKNNLRQRTEFNTVSTVVIGDGYKWENSFHMNSSSTVAAVDECKDSKRIIYLSYLENEIYGLFASVHQKKREDGLSEVNSKTLEPLKHKLADLVLSNKEIKWLDVGCGNGRCLEVLDAIETRRGIYYHGVDLNYDQKVAEEKASRYGIQSYFERNNATNLNFESSYDLISATLLFHELDPLTLPYILRNLIKALKEDGTLVISDFQGPFELEKNVVVWSLEDIHAILEHICNDVRANIVTVRAEKYPSEFAFYYGYIKKTPFNEQKFEEFTNNYDKFLNMKKDESIKERDSLRNQIKMRACEILGNYNIDAKVLSPEEMGYVKKSIEDEYGVKAYKVELLTRQIEFLDRKIKEFAIPVDRLIPLGQNAATFNIDAS
ncbi:Methyltransferase domain protein [uncultured archaeon]|nr:Methyltransferase domain protein [uncultured archaeon]